MTALEVKNHWRAIPTFLSVQGPTAAQKIAVHHHSRKAKRLDQSSSIGELTAYDPAAWRGLILERGANCNAVGQSQRRSFENQTGFALSLKRKAAIVITVCGDSVILGVAAGCFLLHLDGSFDEMDLKVMDSVPIS